MNKLDSKALLEFNFLAKYYDSPIVNSFFSKYYILIKRLLGNLDRKKVLSIGCGTGTLEIDLAKNFPKSKIMGIDLSPKMIKVAKDKSINTPNIRFKQENVENLTDIKERFDNLICLNSFHHYLNSQKILESIKKVLKAQGTLYIVDAIADTLIGRVWIFFNKHTFEPNVKHYSSDQWKNFLKNAGFSKIFIQKIDSVNGLVIAK